MMDYIQPRSSTTENLFVRMLQWMGGKGVNTVCFPSSQGVASVVTKNCEPFVLGPALAMLSVYFVCFRSEISSSNFLPQILSPPVPSPNGSPP